MYEDPIVEEIHRIREEHAKKFNYDLWAIYEDLKAEEGKDGHVVVKLPIRRVPAIPLEVEVVLKP